MKSRWRLTQDQPGEVVELSGLWPPNGLRRLRFEKSTLAITRQSLFGKPPPIAFSSLRGVRFIVGPITGRDLALQLSISYQEDGAPRTETHLFQVALVDKPEEALDLIFRIAQIVGFPTYLLHRKDESGIDLELRPESDAPFREVQGSHQVPIIEESADYLPTQSLPEIAKRDLQRPRFQEPRELAVFDPEKHRGVSSWSKEKIELRIEPEFGWVGTFFYFVLGIPLTIMGWLLLDLLHFTLFVIAFSFTFLAFALPAALLGVLIKIPPWVIGVPIALTSVLVVVVYLFRIFSMAKQVLRMALSMFSQEATFDLASGTFTLRRAKHFWTRRRLTSINAIVLVQHENKMFKEYITKEGRSQRGPLWYEICAKTNWGSLHLWEGKEEAKPNRKESYGLAVALARALDVPFREE